MSIGDSLQKKWRHLAVAGTTALLLGAGIYIVETLPPRMIAMATGAEGGANFELGVLYREILAKEGVKLQLLPTSGGMENLARLRDQRSGVSVGFVQGGTTNRKESPQLESLGTISYEPLWLFRRSEIDAGMRGLAGRRLSIGPEGSGARVLARQLMERTKVDGIIGELSGFTLPMAVEKLVAGDIDAAFIVAAWESPAVQKLINAKGIEIENFPRADAYIAIFPFLNKLILPAGVIDFLQSRPPADVVLLAPKASLVVRKDLHPALQYLLLNAAVQIRFAARDFPEGRTISRSRINRSPTER